MATSCSLLIPHSQVAVLNLPKEPLNPLTLPGKIPSIPLPSFSHSSKFAGILSAALS